MSRLVGAVLTRPTLDLARAAAILASHWGIAGDLRPLPSERDRNVAVRIDGVDAFVLKVSNATDDRALLEFQHEALLRLRDGGVPCPEPVPSAAGDVLVELGDAAEPLFARVMRWVPGRPLSTVPPARRSPALLRGLGALMGRTAAALERWDHPAAHRPFQWNPLAARDVIDAHAPAVVDPVRAALLREWRSRLEPLGTTLPALPASVIHNDANDHNVLVAEDGSAVVGLLDMGDAVWSVTVSELAVAAAYAALDAPDALAVIRTVREGFEETHAVSGVEREVIVELVALRLATSVALSAHQARLDPGDTYLTVSEAPAWRLLERLAEIDPPTAAAAVAS